MTTLPSGPSYRDPPSGAFGGQTEKPHLGQSRITKKETRETLSVGAEATKTTTRGGRELEETEPNKVKVAAGEGNGESLVPGRKSSYCTGGG